MRDLWLVELVAYDPGVPGTVTLRLSTGPYTTLPTETPANTIYDARITQPVNISRTLFGYGTTTGRSAMGLGDLVLANDDGALDGWLAYGFDGRALTIRRAKAWTTWADRARPAYPSEFDTVLVATMEQAEFGSRTVTVKLRDRQYELDVSLQTTKYAGTNALPDGLEGTADDLLGKPKPVCLGKVTNCAPPCVNTSRLIYQLNDGAVASVDGVYDRGVALGEALWVLVGTSGKIATSPDGATWTQATSPFGASTLYAVTFGAATFVAAGASGKLASSTDGGAWTSQTSQFGASQINGLAYGNSTFVAVGASGKVATSSDGATWTLVCDNVGVLPDPFSGGAIYTAAYGAGLWVLMGAAGKCYTTTDFVTFTSRTSQFGADAVVKVIFADSLFVAVGANAKCSTSANGTAWTAQTTGAGTQLNDVAYGNGVWVATSLVTGANSLFLSADSGVTWTARAFPCSTALTATQAIAFGDGRFVGALGNYGIAGTSLDGSAWLAVPDSTFTAADYIIAAVYGTGLAASTYANATDLEDDSLAPQPGMWKVYLAGGYIRLGSAPIGLLTADVTQGAAASDRTAGQLYTDLLARAGMVAADWVAADITALDTANSAVLGYWTDQETTVAAVCDLVAASVGAWWGVGAAGTYRIAVFDAPSGSAVAAFTENDALRPLERLATNDEGHGIPTWRCTVRWGRCYAVQGTDLAGAVTATRRALVSKEWREASDEDASVQTAHLLAGETLEDSLLTSAADAGAEATRRLALRGVRRDRFALTVPLDTETGAIDLADVVTLTYPRFGLHAGDDFLVVGLTPDVRRQELALEVWG